jgi:transglutaminase-like putative cysteine protease
MRARVSYRTIHLRAEPARSLERILRLTPRNQESQRVASWRIDVDADCVLRTAEDAFGNITHAFSVAGPIERLVTRIDGEIETFDTTGVARGAHERFPPELFLRPTALTRADDAHIALAREIAATDAGVLARAHALMHALADRRDKATTETDDAVETAAHDFIVCARLMEIPARYVSGFRLDSLSTDLSGPHGWAEAFVEGLGWVGFDAVHRLCPDETHICLARGLDALGAAPWRSEWRPRGEERLETAFSFTLLDNGRY